MGVNGGHWPAPQQKAKFVPTGFRLRRDAACTRTLATSLCCTPFVTSLAFRPSAATAATGKVRGQEGAPGEKGRGTPLFPAPGKLGRFKFVTRKWGLTSRGGGSTRMPSREEGR